MNERIRLLLNEVYEPAQAEATYQHICDLLERYRHLISAPKVINPLTERDVVLITYADTLQQKNVPPLETLYQFSVEHFKGFISAIHLLPFYPASSDDGFSVIDYYMVDPDFGTWEHIQRLGQEFDLMFDAVINHMSAKSDWFRRFLNQEQEYAQAFVTATPQDDLSKVVRPRTSPLLTAFTRPNGETIHVWTTFSADQVDLNYHDPQTLLRVLDVLLFYVQHGARFLRLDAIAFLWKELHTPCIHLPQTHAIIQLVRAVFDEIAPHVLLITETNVPHDENISYFGNGYNEAQLVYNFTLPPLLFYSLLKADATHLKNWINTLTTPSERTTFFNFTASHDGIGLRPVEKILPDEAIAEMLQHVEKRGGRVSYRSQNGNQSPYELNITYLDAMAIASEGDDLHVQSFLLSQAIMLALAGMPAVYIHSLLGTRNDIQYMQTTGHPRSINRSKLDANHIRGELADHATLRAKIFRGYKHLISTRIQQAMFAPTSAQQALGTQNSSILALQRGEIPEHMLCLFNLSPQKQDISLAHGGIDVLSEQHINSGTLALAPYQFLWIKGATLTS